MKLVRGSREPLNPDEPVLPDASVEPTIRLTGDERKVWDESIVPLVTARSITSVDVGRAARNCRWEALGGKLLTEAATRKGKERAELIRLAAHCHSVADRTWTALGVGDPRERNRMRTPPKADDALARFKARHA